MTDVGGVIPILGIATVSLWPSQRFNNESVTEK
jgi:hypothetical protein